MVTVEQLAFQLGANPKTIRAFLRKVFPRPFALKNTPWELDAEMVVAIVRRYG